MQQKRNEDANRVRVRSQGDWNAVDEDGNENAASRALQRKGHQLVGFTRVRGESRKEFDAYDAMIVGEERTNTLENPRIVVAYSTEENATRSELIGCS